MLALRESGFFGKDEIELTGGIRVAPLDVTARLLFPLWALEPGEQEFTLLHVVVEGRVGDRFLRHTYDLYDEYDSATAMTSMARTTGFPCVIVARMLAEGSLSMPGVHPPEALGMREGMLAKITAELASRSVFLHDFEEDLPALQG
jgi:lysine 6-dehydrogenase